MVLFKFPPSLCNHKYFSQIFDASKITAENLLSPENQKKCIEKLKKFPVVMDKNKPEKFAAILIPICVNSEGKLSLLFTKRSANIRTHVRQISFPGGMRDLNTESNVECALRETEEEIGLIRSRIKIWGSGSLIRAPRSPAIMPIVGVIENLQTNELKLNENEVEKIIMVNIDELCSPNVRKHTQFRSGYSAPLFLVNNGEDKIWGLTGAITNLFLSSLLPNDIFSPRIDYIKSITSDNQIS